MLIVLKRDCIFVVVFWRWWWWKFTI